MDLPPTQPNFFFFFKKRLRLLCLTILKCSKIKLKEYAFPSALLLLCCSTKYPDHHNFSLQYQSWYLDLAVLNSSGISHISQTSSLIIVVVKNPKVFLSSNISFIPISYSTLVDYLSHVPASIEHHFSIIPPFLLGGDSAPRE